MTLKSIEKLRNLHERGCGCVPDCINCSLPEELGEIADEIEREISDRYMELPVDADGVPIHVGDEIHVDEKLIGIDGGKKVYVAFVGNECFAAIEPFEYYDPSYCRHVKPDPIKELLEEFANHGTLTGDGGILFEAGLIEQYADKLREAVSAE